MRIQIAADPEALAQAAADIICGAVREKPEALLGLPTGATPIATYVELARRVERGDVSFRRATIYAIDEFASAAAGAPGTNSAFYAEHVWLGQRQLRCPDASAAGPAEHIAAFADEIRLAGNLDLCVLGIGLNGHVAFNEPGTAADSRAHVVTLTDASRSAHAAGFGSLDAVPSCGMTLGMADLMESRHLLVMACGMSKAAIVRQAIEGPQTPDVPASWLRSHHNVTWLLDEAAASRLTQYA